MHVLGCDEHYLAHVLRSHEDFVPELNLVVELDGRVIGSVMYTRAWLTDESGNEREILTFGPAAMLVKALKPDAFDGRRWFYRESVVYEIDPAEAEEFDRQFVPKEKAFRTSQEEFSIHSHSVLQD